VRTALAGAEDRRRAGGPARRRRAARWRVGRGPRGGPHRTADAEQAAEPLAATRRRRRPTPGTCTSCAPRSRSRQAGLAARQQDLVRADRLLASSSGPSSGPRTATLADLAAAEHREQTAERTLAAATDARGARPRRGRRQEASSARAALGPSTETSRPPHGAGHPAGATAARGRGRPGRARAARRRPARAGPGSTTDAPPGGPPPPACCTRSSPAHGTRPTRRTAHPCASSSPATPERSSGPAWRWSSTRSCASSVARSTG
jgi:hypothetical protein